ncbi:MAG TPA: ATP-binding protein [Steroidobacteraceae bacterium]|nr:ATP-binding protein [Steroidobacteraceae bacterium]
MDASFPALIQILLATGRTLALQLNEKLAVRVVHNAPLLIEWRGRSDALPGSLNLLLEELLQPPRAREIAQRIAAAANEVDEAGVALGTGALRVPQDSGPEQYAALSLHRLAEGDSLPLLLLLRDVTALEAVQHALTQTRDSLTAAMASLRAPPQALRMYLAAGMASVGELRAMMKLQARDEEALRAKLARLAQGVESLEADARAADLPTVTEACADLGQYLTGLRQRPQLSGDDLLPIAPLLDRVASGFGNAIRIEEQRYSPPAAAAKARRDDPPAGGKTQDWAELAERRWNSFLRRRNEETGTLVKLRMRDARLVPAARRRAVDDMLQHLLRNAIEHGIETPEQRLAAGKPATGEIIVQFADKGPQGVTMTVRDDGRGLDIGRIGRAAVRSGLLSEESLAGYDPGRIVGLIFRPGFSTQNLEGESGRGRGMDFLRRAVARADGQITVATKPGRYTQFVIELPAAATPGTTAI